MFTLVPYSVMQGLFVKARALHMAMASLASQLALGILSSPSEAGITGGWPCPLGIYMAFSQDANSFSCLHNKHFNDQTVSPVPVLLFEVQT